MDDKTITMYTTGWCGDCRAAKRALDQAGMAYVEIDVEHDAEALARLVALNDGRRSVPTLELGGVAASLSGFSPAKLDAFLRAAGLR
jgi:mycoredoxin